MAKKTVKSTNLLPEFFRTEKNRKFLSSTLDQWITPPELERIDGYVGSTNTPTYNSTSDVYLSEILPLRKQYQLEPAVVIKDDLGTVNDVIGIDDLINEISINGGITDNLGRLFDPKIYSFDPQIDWDKLINYNQYYWLPTGPQTITIAGIAGNTTSTYSVIDNELKTAYIFSPDGIQENPIITLYRGNTYNFNINSVNPMYIKTDASLGSTDLLSFNISNNGITTGTITLVVDQNTPEFLFYAVGDQQVIPGKIIIKTSTDNSYINVDSEIIGKKQYISGNGVKFSNGMKIRFAGYVMPEKYQDKEFWVEGVGSEIKLIDISSLVVSEAMSEIYDDDFDASNFDSFPYDSFKTLPLVPEYVTINRASQDLNPWSRYNRWVHAEIIRISAEQNGTIPDYPANQRAKRPIIEFNANLKLFNFGTYGVNNVDFIDSYTTDAFSMVEGFDGYHVDGILLQQGHRVIFNADTDALVRNKVFEVNYVKRPTGGLRISLEQVDGNVLKYGNCLSVNLGNKYQGTSWWFDGDKWVYAQQHKTLNQAPLFDLFDDNGDSYSNINIHKTNFSGTKIFGYAIGTGNNDVVLGFPLQYRNSVGVGSYLFNNYYNTDVILESTSNIETIEVPVSQTFLKYTGKLKDRYVNIWSDTKKYIIPVIQSQILNIDIASIEIVAIDNPATTQFGLIVYINNKKINITDYTVVGVKNKVYVSFNNTLYKGDSVVFKIYTSAPANSKGYYDVPVGLTNNPLNGYIESFTLSELSDHLQTAVERISTFQGIFPGVSNLRDINNISSFSTRLITNVNPVPFAHIFIGKKEHSIIDAIDLVCNQYNQFKMNFLSKLVSLDSETTPFNAIETVLADLNQTKNLQSPYYLSDMVPYGVSKLRRSWTITNINNKNYSLKEDFNLNELSLKSVLVYLNDIQLIHGTEYQFVVNDSSVDLLIDLNIGDSLIVDYYTTTIGSYVPPTPTKLGLYPKFEPKIYIDYSYVTPTKVIQGHDGSILVAYNDYRDEIILELEKRIYNNIKVEYRPELFDINSILAGAFRQTQFSITENNKILYSSFLKWAGFYGIDYISNDTVDKNNEFTWNYLDCYNEDLEISLFGFWRGMYKFLYDTDRPNLCPWEMLGFSQKPSWWEDTYGPAPYTSGNELLWKDLENGVFRYPNNYVVNSLYARPGLSKIIPVTETGDLVPPTALLPMNTNATPPTVKISESNKRANWKFGDQGPAETAWRRSSYWPFAVQKLLALSSPATYSSLMYDPKNMIKNITGLWAYRSTNTFLNPKSMPIFGIDNTLTSGYSVLIVEAGCQKDLEYKNKLLTDLSYVDVNLFYKVGGFINKNNIQITIDAYEPNTPGSGALLPYENYNLILNVSNPVKVASISGIIIQKIVNNDGRLRYVVKGYDKTNPYFNVYTPGRNSSTPTLTVGGVSATYVYWEAAADGGGSNLSSFETTTAYSATNSKFYRAGQIVRYGNNYFIVKVDHKSESTFNSSYYSAIPQLPVIGGITVQGASYFDKNAKSIIYGTELESPQEVYDFIIGYGAWLIDQGFVFDNYNSDIGDIIDWNFSAKEFLYWVTQNWENNSILALSPFADQLKYQFNQSVVDNIFNNFYEYSILQENGFLFPQQNLNVNRNDGICTISAVDTPQGIYHAKLYCVQKEHGIVFDNKTIFNDTIYDIETGYRQRRVKLSGFRTSKWDGDYFTPGFIYDVAKIVDWQENRRYFYGDVVRFNSNYYSAIENVDGAIKFDFSKWQKLGSKPTAGLISNFDYKINQFEDFYSLDVDNFDAAQQKMAQHLIGYTPRVYLNNIFVNPIAQYKFYQGFIREKGSRNAIEKLSKSSIQASQGSITFNEEWAFRIGSYGSYSSYQEIEFPLNEGTFKDNPQAIQIVDTDPSIANSILNYVTPRDFIISPTDFTTENVFVTTNETNFKIGVAGYVHADDISRVVYNKDALLSITDLTLLREGDYCWVGFTDDNDWEVYRYERANTVVISVIIINPTVEIEFTTLDIHNLAIGDIIVISQFDSQVDGIYKITSIPTLTTFRVASSIAFISDFEIPQVGGLVFTFFSARYDEFDVIPSDQQLRVLPVGSKLWIDNAATGQWVVYNKIQNFKVSNLSTGTYQSALGWNVNKNKDSDIIMVSSPLYETIDINDIGLITVKDLTENKNIFNFTLNEQKRGLYHTGTSTTELISEFGQSLFYDPTEFNDSGYGLFFAGAPAANKVKGFVNNTGIINTTSNYTDLLQKGLVKITSLKSSVGREDTSKTIVFRSTSTQSFERFGHSIYVQTQKYIQSTPQVVVVNEVTTATSTDTKILLVGAPCTKPTGDANLANLATGTVYMYDLSITNTSTTKLAIGGNYSTTTVSELQLSLPEIISAPREKVNGSEWGYSITGLADGSRIAISAPSWSTSTGYVAIYTATDFVSAPTIIDSPFGVYSRFGEKILMSQDGEYLFISAPYKINPDRSAGVVMIYKWNSINYNYQEYQTIYNPIAGSTMNFGMAMDINRTNDELVISSLGTSIVREEFDSNLSDGTTFDGGSTYFNEFFKDSGLVFVYSRKNLRFVFSEEINSQNYEISTNFGKSLVLDDTKLYVGSPNIGTIINNPYSFIDAFCKCNDLSNLLSSDSTANIQFSGLFYYDKEFKSDNGWKVLRKFENLVEPFAVKRATLVDTFKEEIIDYLDFIDPAKGKIAGLADQELKYKSMFDPAVYTVGTSTTVTDPGNSWLEKQVGQLWWDLSTVKYIWYEQGDATYRKNNWGQVFPGSSIDIYEWVESPYLPNEWAAIADTSKGLTLGISGQPKYPNNTSLSAKQIYNSITNSFTNVYYYWVKNKVTTPSIKNRRISAYEVASLIRDPVSYGLLCLNVISSNAIALSNVEKKLVGNRISINIAYDEIQNQIPKHTEWALLKENSRDSFPPALLEKKLIDSLLGHDSIGNAVPNPDLPSRVRYGIGIRPQQTMFKDRLEALRNLIEFSNSILKENLITGNYKFENLNAQENIPDEYSYMYDQIVEDNESLLIIDTLKIQTAELSCTVKNGKIVQVNIENPGFGYLQPPKIKIIGDNSEEAEIIVEIDSLGKVTNAIIKNAGNGYISPPTLTARSYSVIVQTDLSYNGRWTLFSWKSDVKEWVREKTQKYNTTLYWKYIDWASLNYNQYQDYIYSVDSTYQIYMLENVLEGQYIKVNNVGDGNYVILEKLSLNNAGTFGNGYDLVYKENGTIQILDSIWNLSSSSYGFDQNSSYDQTLFDQVPDIELTYILKALKDDIFVNELKINWNLFFFKAVRYALTEQKLLDWAFKTSFINVVNLAGYLDQRSVYKLQNTKYFEDYIKEVKPYRSQIRGFTTNYNLIDYSNNMTTDFDLPAYYDSQVDKFILPTAEQLNEYPWKNWNDNYTFGVGEILVGNPGSGFRIPPTVELVTKDGDFGSGATAIAYIRSGKIVSFEVTNPGSGYIVPPDVIIKGGGIFGDTTARGYAKLYNGKVRSNIVNIKFDRISRTTQLGNRIVTDTFIANGATNSFVLSWLVEPKKSLIKIYVDKVRVLTSDYTIQYYTENYNGYQKKYSKLVFLNYVPTENQEIVVTYQKSQELFTALDRIENYYQPTSGMAGNTSTQLMKGIEYPETRLIGLDFNDTADWDVLFGSSSYSLFGTTSYADKINSYQQLKLKEKSRSSSNRLIFTSTQGLSVGQHVNIIDKTNTSVFSTSSVYITDIDTKNNVVRLSSKLTRQVTTGTVVEFWSYDATSNRLDSVIDGGKWVPGYLQPVLVNALGINPEDTIIDGSEFYTPESGYSTEELINGQINESFGINVYTKNPSGPPLVLSSTFDVERGKRLEIPLTILPTDADGISVIYNNIIYERVEYERFFRKENEYWLDYENKLLILPPQSSTGKGSYTIILIGGGDGTRTPGVLDYQYLSLNNIDASYESVEVTSSVGIVSVKGVYVTINGLPRDNTQYTLTQSNNQNGRAAVVLNPLPREGIGIQVWFLSTPMTDPYNPANSYYNLIQQQVFEAGVTPQTEFNLTWVPGNLEPIDAQVILEIEDSSGRKQLVPPYISYYQITSVQSKLKTTFSINNRIPHAPDSYTLDSIRVYKNGIALLPGFDFILNSSDNTITIYPSKLKIGDAIAIVGLIDGEYDFDIIGKVLYVPLKSQTGVSNASFRLITFTNHDTMLMRTERFPRNTLNRYQVSRPIMSMSYIWVSVNGIPLKSRLEYDVLDDGVTVRLTDDVITNPGDEIVIRSISDLNLATKVIGYRMFTDMLGRSHYKRLSRENSTRLTTPLSHTDTEINVENARVLTSPNSSKNLPGVVIINGERIEFFEKTGNKLKKLRRGTLGTSPSFYLDVNTKVIDQGVEQSIPYTERINRQTLYTTASVNTYNLNQTIIFNKKATDYYKIIPHFTQYTQYVNVLHYGDGTQETYPDLKVGDLISGLDIQPGTYVTSIEYGQDTETFAAWWSVVLSKPHTSQTYRGDFTVTVYNSELVAINDIDAVNQISVFYGGRTLSKSGNYYQDQNMSYDSPEMVLIGFIETTDSLPSNGNLGEAYVVQETNQVWIYTESLEVSAINGFTYKGLKYVDPEFTVDTVNNSITLNIKDGVQDNIELVIMQKSYGHYEEWVNTGTSILESTTEIAKFLQERPAELPDSLYYGSNRDGELITENGEALTDINGNPLKGN